MLYPGTGKGLKTTIDIDSREIKREPVLRSAFDPRALSVIVNRWQKQTGPETDRLILDSDHPDGAPGIGSFSV